MWMRYSGNVAVCGEWDAEADAWKCVVSSPVGKDVKFVSRRSLAAADRKEPVDDAYTLDAVARDAIAHASQDITIGALRWSAVGVVVHRSKPEE